MITKHASAGIRVEVVLCKQKRISKKIPIFRMDQRRSLPFPPVGSSSSVKDERDFVRFCKDLCLSSFWLESPIDWWNQLPVEVLLNVVDFLGPVDVFRATRVCSDWRRKILKVPRPRMIVEHYVAQIRRKSGYHFDVVGMMRETEEEETEGDEEEVEDQSGIVHEITEKVCLCGEFFTKEELVELQIDSIISVTREPRAL